MLAVPAFIPAPSAPAQCAAPVSASSAAATASLPAPAASSGKVALTQPAPATSGPAKEPKWYSADADAFPIVWAGHGLSFHKPMYVMPVTYSPAYHGQKTEFIFEISLKQRLFGIPLFVAYTQKSFWEAYYTSHSAPFRETDYNPELFYRVPAHIRWFNLGADFGIEHESNGQGLPNSRSWNRIYFAPFERSGEHLVYWKWWWRLPENEGRPRTDPERDDNPDIGSFYGYSELTYEQQLFNDKHLLHVMGRYNPGTGRGAINVQYTIPNNSENPAFFWFFSLWEGYGESLIDYNHSIFRLGVGVSVAR